MRVMIIYAIMCAVSSSYIFSNVVFTKQNITRVSKADEEQTPQKNVFNNNTNIESEPYMDLNKNGKYNFAEQYIDYNQNGKWNDGEPFEDLNDDGIKGYNKPLIDIANAWYDQGEEYDDLDGDSKWTIGDENHDSSKQSSLNQQDGWSSIYDTLTTSVQNDTIANLSLLKKSFKSPGKALLYSGVIPGTGQMYMGNWKRGLLFVALEYIAFGTLYQNNKLANDKKQEYVNYSREHWSFERWIHDYYKWYEYQEGDDGWNSIREVFINYSDSTYGCAQDPTQGHCYVDIWDHSHKVEFTYDGRTMSSSSNEFREVFQTLCGNSNIIDKECSKDILDLKDSNDDTLFVIKDHHFYEGIQKYDMFFAGWDDNDSVFVNEKGHGDKNATSLNQITYRNLWGRYNTIKTLAVNGGKFMLINRVVSMVDALLLAKKWNNKHEVKLSLNTYPDLRNKFGIGGVKLSLHFK